MFTQVCNITNFMTKKQFSINKSSKICTQNLNKSISFQKITNRINKSRDKSPKILHNFFKTKLFNQ